MKTYTLQKRKNGFGEYVVKCYVDGKRFTDGDYFADDWQDAVDTKAHMERQAAELNKPIVQMDLSDLLNLLQSPKSQHVPELPEPVKCMFRRIHAKYPETMIITVNREGLWCFFDDGFRQSHPYTLTDSDVAYLDTMTNALSKLIPFPAIFEL